MKGEKNANTSVKKPFEVLPGAAVPYCYQEAIKHFILKLNAVPSLECKITFTPYSMVNNKKTNSDTALTFIKTATLQILLT